MSDTTVLGPLGPGESECFDVQLKGHRVYSIYVNPHKPFVDFDLEVYDGYGNLIDQDIDPDSDAICTIETYRKGTFSILVECERGFSTYEILIQESRVLA